MKKYILVISILIFWQKIFASQIHILFIGNSYTYVNDLPQLLHDLALTNGDTIIFDSSTPGGYTLQSHSTLSTTLSKIAQGNWDYVVLQEQSQMPAFSPSQVATSVLPYAHILDSLIHDGSPCAQTIFYMTWGRKNGDASNCANYPPICTYNGMQQRLRQSYVQMAFDNNALVSPVGEAWRRTRNLFPNLNLYNADESHPSIEGSYLAACTFYCSIFKNSTVGNSFISTLTQNDALAIQQIASSTVLDSVDVWNTNVYYPNANFAINNLGNSQFYFENTSSNATNYTWNFGDGSFSNIIDVTHQYNILNPNVNVTLTANNNCFASTKTFAISSVLENISGNNISKETLFFYDNNEIKIASLNREKLNIKCFNSNGEAINLLQVTPTSFNVSHLPIGIYFLVDLTSNVHYKFCVVK